MKNTIIITLGLVIAFLIAITYYQANTKIDIAITTATVNTGVKVTENPLIGNNQIGDMHQIVAGTSVVLLDRGPRFTKVKTPFGEGWIHNSELTNIATLNFEL